METIEVHGGVGDQLRNLLIVVQVRQFKEYEVIITETPADLVSFLIGFYQECTKKKEGGS